MFKIITALLICFSFGCNGALPNGYVPPATVSPPNSTPKAGNWQNFKIYVINTTAWDVTLDVQVAIDLGNFNFNIWNLSGSNSWQGTVTLPAHGGFTTFDFWELPSNVFVEATSTAVPPIIFPAQVQYLNTDYSPTTQEISFPIQ